MSPLDERLKRPLSHADLVIVGTTILGADA